MREKEKKKTITNFHNETSKSGTCFDEGITSAAELCVDDVSGLVLLAECHDISWSLISFFQSSRSSLLENKSPPVLQ